MWRCKLANNIVLTDHQNKALEEILTVLREPYGVAILGGFAGTGKTTLMRVIYDYVCNIDGANTPIVAAFTGKAVQRAQEVMGMNDVGITLHSLMYRPVVDHTGAIISWTKREENPACPVLVDEASMLSEELYNDVVDFAQKHGCSILFMGDPFQLPPIEGSFNIMNNPTVTLTEIHRQAEGSIINASMKLRDLKIDLKDLPLIKRRDALKQYLESDDAAFICMSNKDRVLWNSRVRKALGYPEKRLVEGDKIIVLKNNKFYSAFNGQVFTIQKIHTTEGEREGEHPRIYTVSFVEREGVVDISSSYFDVEKPVAPLTKPIRELLYTDYGYALTCHKAQGSQYSKVFIENPSWMLKKMGKESYCRWMYTAITRGVHEASIMC